MIAKIDALLASQLQIESVERLAFQFSELWPSVPGASSGLWQKDAWCPVRRLTRDDTIWGNRPQGEGHVTCARLSSNSTPIWAPAPGFQSFTTLPPNQCPIEPRSEPGSTPCPSFRTGSFVCLFVVASRTRLQTHTQQERPEALLVLYNGFGSTPLPALDCQARIYQPVVFSPEDSLYRFLRTLGIKMGASLGLLLIIGRFKTYDSDKNIIPSTPNLPAISHDQNPK